jgi:hypothetical protein
MKDQIEILRKALAKSERERRAMAGALNIVHDEAEKLLEANCDPQEVAERLKLFSSLGRYKFDVRTAEGV